MDIYRYFHPHHNPRLRKTPIRLQELNELEEAARELRRAVERAGIRTSASPDSPIIPEHFSELSAALEYVVENLKRLSAAHPGDPVETLEHIWEERKRLPGWETWSRIVKERISGEAESDFSREGK